MARSSRRWSPRSPDFSADKDPLVIAIYAVAAYAALANRAVSHIAALHVGQSVIAALKRGVVFRTADAFDRAGRVSTAAFCARGTLLLGEPEVASIEAFGTVEASAVLAFVAGTEGGASHPTAVAIQRAARARGVRPDGVRSPATQPGLGVTAIAASGQTLVVGSRGLMLRERISVALAESKITDLEAMGRTVLLVALGGKLVGLVGLQDGLRPGARAAVQHLLDAGLEPVLLSGDTRETCEALGRAVDIDHIRPEVLPADRGDGDQTTRRRRSDGRRARSEPQRRRRPLGSGRVRRARFRRLELGRMERAARFRRRPGRSVRASSRSRMPEGRRAGAPVGHGAEPRLHAPHGSFSRADGDSGARGARRGGDRRLAAPCSALIRLRKSASCPFTP